MHDGATTFNAVAHCTTVFYYVQVLRNIAAVSVAPGSSRVLTDFQELRPKFFTMWGVAAQTLFFVLCAMHDASRVLSPSNPLRRGARSLRDLVLVAVAGPMAVTVTAMFWGLFLLDRDLVMPAALDAVIPVWMNHAMHSFVLVLVVVQLLAEPHHPPALGTALGVGLALSGSYTYVLYNEYAQNGRWIYPVFAVLGWPGRVALSAFTSALFLSQVVVVRAAVKARWGYSKDNTKSIKKRKD